jgi:hypothetical protein
MTQLPVPAVHSTKQYVEQLSDISNYNALIPLQMHTNGPLDAV